MLKTSVRVADAFWRAAAYCLRPQVILLSALPVLLAAGAALGLSWLFWERAVAGVQRVLESWQLVDTVFNWLSRVGLEGLRVAVAPLLLLVVAVPVLLVLSMLLVATFMTPAMTRLVARRRFPGLEARRGGGFWGSLLWSLGHSLAALGMLAISLPFWLLPPVALVAPPLIWGWLAFRIFAYDALAEHASVPERRFLLNSHRTALMGMGVVTGFLGGVPAVVWPLGVMTVVLSPLLAVISVWLYTLVFAFASLWFAHYTLMALHELREIRGEPGAGDVLDVEATVVPSALPGAAPSVLPSPDVSEPPRTAGV